jgi:hypothetical protein
MADDSEPLLADDEKTVADIQRNLEQLQKKKDKDRSVVDVLRINELSRLLSIIRFLILQRKRQEAVISHLVEENRSLKTETHVRSREALSSLVPPRIVYDSDLGLPNELPDERSFHDSPDPA